MSSPVSRRRHDIDALRAIAFGLLILYHVGMFYVSWGWHVKSAHEARWLEPVMVLVNQWRMPLIFLVSGLAVNFLLGEDKPRRMGYGAFAWLRVRRLALPLLFGMAVIVPPQSYYEALRNGAAEPGYLAFLWDYFTFRPWPDGAFAGSDPGITWNHLWYLPYLLTYTLALIPIAAFLDGPGRRLRQVFRALRGSGLVLVPVAWLMPIGLWVFPVFPYISHDLLTDGYAHAMFGSFFLFGYLIGRDPGLWAAMARMRWVTLPLALVTYAALMAARTIVPADPPVAQEAAQIFVIYLNRWTWILVVLGWAHRLLNRPMGWLTYANRAVYPWYILHQSVTVVAGVWLTRLGVGPVAEPVLLIGATIAGCAATMFVVERWLPWLRPVLGMTHGRTRVSAHGESGSAARTQQAIP